MKKFTKIFVVAALAMTLAFTAIACGNNKFTLENFDRLEVGMSVSQVESTLGKADSKTIVFGTGEMTYRNSAGDTAVIIFVLGALLSASFMGADGTTSFVGLM